MKKLPILFLLGIVYLGGYAQQLVHFIKQPGDFAMHEAAVLTHPSDITLVHKVAGWLSTDIEKVTGRPIQQIEKTSGEKSLIIIGSLQSPLIQQLIRDKKIRSQSIEGKWEAYLIQTVPNPLPGVSTALVIAGSDRRGTAYGVLDLSAQIGVSPWYWWADVPVQKHSALYVSGKAFKTDSPLVKYRGIFINDEAPALSGWTREKFGGFNHKLYENVFELILRNKANYLWPAMWGNAFYDDDSINIKIANDFGIVIGTSHHEPLMRAHDEWRRYGKKQKWNYDSTESGLKEFWRGGMQRAQNEKIVTVGMRGDGDEPMSRQTATALLERIVKDQRSIIEEVTGKPASETPQLWALYKEVQDYYDKGMRVPDDITLLLCDDNWGNLRRLPTLGETPRKGGYGIYYHFDYVGGPRNYKWINTNNITRVWEQMHLAWEYNARQIWIVNVGDIKPMELPISFFLDYAWNPTRIKATDLTDYHQRWASQQFGNSHAADIGYLLQKIGQYNSRRKPEMLSAETYSISEWHSVMNDWNLLLKLYKKIAPSLPKETQDALYQLVEHPLTASQNIHVLYQAVAENHRYAKTMDPRANQYADSARKAYEKDSLISLHYNKKLANGKWNHMMDQTHIGYTNWQQPPFNKMPVLKIVSPDSAITQTQEKKSLPNQSALHLIPKNKSTASFYEWNGYISIESAHYSKAISNNSSQWQVLPGIGRTGDGITRFPVTAPEQIPGPNSPHLEYDVYTYNSGRFKLHAYFSPTLNFQNTEEGLRFAISIDDEKPQVISINKEDRNTGTGIWNKWVGENIIIKTSEHQLLKPGKHVIKFWVVDNGVVLQKLVADFGGLLPSYLGPAETKKQ